MELKTNPEQLPSRDLAALPMIPTHEEEIKNISR